MSKHRAYTHVQIIQCLRGKLFYCAHNLLSYELQKLINTKHETLYFFKDVQHVRTGRFRLFLLKPEIMASLRFNPVK